MLGWARAASWSIGPCVPWEGDSLWHLVGHNTHVLRLLGSASPGLN